MSASPTHDRYGGVQVLRFVAALLVVITHSSLCVSERMPYLQSGVWEKGGIGVSIFFVVSGFVIVLSSDPLLERRGGWQIFAYRRLLRIVPLYWIATTLKLLVVLTEPSVALHSGLNWLHVTLSYLFLPSRNPLGVVTPLHAVGWTLTFEMFFYAVFCVALYLKLPPLRFVAFIFAVLIVWGLIDPAFSANWSVVVYTSPIVLEFLMGMLIAELVKRPARIPPTAGLCAIVLGVVMIWHFDLAAAWPAFFFHGIPAALIVAGVVFLEPTLSKLSLGGLEYLGAASYALYLFHPFVITLCGIALAKLRLTDVPVSIGLMTLAAVAVSVAVHRWLEEPITNALKGVIKRREVSLGQPMLRH